MRYSSPMLRLAGLRFAAIALLSLACSSQSPNETADARVGVASAQAKNEVPAKTTAATATKPSQQLDPGSVAGADWWSTVQRKLENSDYRFQQSAQGFETGNRDHNLLARFQGSEVHLTARTADDIKGPVLFTRDYERVGWTTPLSNGAPVLGACDGSGRTDERDQCLRRLEYQPRSDLVEWWLNTREGLEQGWTLTQKPAGEGHLTIGIAVTGAGVKVTPQGVRMVSKGGLSVRCEKPIATDNRGRALSVMFAQREGGFSLLVDDHDAAYPITIDPVYITWDWTAESNQISASFGFSLAGAGDVNNDGYSDVIVGAYQYDGGNTDEGAAFLYLGSDLGLSETPVWSAEGNQDSANFGYSVAAAGDVNNDGYDDVIVGSHLYDDGPLNDGAGFVYHG
jgi:hypothetical protein